MTASRISLLCLLAMASSLRWRTTNRSRTIPLTIPIADRTPMVPRQFRTRVMVIPTLPSGTTSPYPTVHRVCTT